MAERVRLMRDSVINNSAPFVAAVIGLFLVPIMLKGLGLELYGLWLAAMADSGMLAGLDFGLNWSLVRDVAAAENDESQDETARFVMAAGNADGLLGVAGGVLIGTLGYPLSSGLHFSAEPALAGTSCLHLWLDLLFSSGRCSRIRVRIEAREVV
jgi:O-antigen/teichoic acid export membrane protein